MKQITHADMARYLAQIARTATMAQVSLAEGMWNPDFCSAECSIYALSICEDLRVKLDALEKRATHSSTTHGETK